MLPNYNLEMYPIHPLRVVNASFSHKLLNNSEDIPSFGFISIDQARQLYPLAKDDPLAKSIPLIGIWIKGISSISDKLVQNACFQYISNQKLIKLDTGKTEMLIYHFPSEQNGKVQCYECIYTCQSSDSPWELYGTENNCLFKRIKNEIGFWNELEQIFEM
jgi:SCL-interrupting locus protein N-terminus